MTPRPPLASAADAPEPEGFDDDLDEGEGEGVPEIEETPEVEATPQKLATGMAVIRAFWETLPGSPGCSRHSPKPATPPKIRSQSGSKPITACGLPDCARVAGCCAAHAGPHGLGQHRGRRQ